MNFFEYLKKLEFFARNDNFSNIFEILKKKEFLNFFEFLKNFKILKNFDLFEKKNSKNLEFLRKNRKILTFRIFCIFEKFRI